MRLFLLTAALLFSFAWTEAGANVASPPDGGSLSFVFVGRMPAKQDEAGQPTQFAVYVSVQGSAFDSDGLSVIVAEVADHPFGKGVSYRLKSLEFYCRPGKVRTGSVAYFNADNQLVEQTQSPSKANDSRRPGLDPAFATACGTRKAEGPPLQGVDAIRADAKARFLAEPVN